jgi:peptidyl-prolyl cis-trans isomerase C
VVLASCGPSENRAAISIDPAVVALVNSDPIYGADVQLEAAALGYVQPGEELAVDDPRFLEIMEQLIDQRLLAQEAEARALDEDEAAAHRLRVARERLLGNILVETVVAEQVGEQAIRDMYDQQVRLLQMGVQVRARHILVATEQEAAELVEELGDGSTFAAVAFLRSRDPTTRLESGDLGFVNPEEFEPTFADALSSTPLGQMSAPFATEAGWHIVKVEERRTQPPPTLEELRPEIIRFMTFQEIDGIIQRLRARSMINRLVGDAAGSDDPLATDAPPERPRARPAPAPPPADAPPADGPTAAQGETPPASTSVEGASPAAPAPGSSPAPAATPSQPSATTP